MSLKNLESQYPKGPRVVVRYESGNAARKDAQLDKTLSHIEVKGRPGPQITPGGHGSIWKDKP